MAMAGPGVSNIDFFRFVRLSPVGRGDLQQLFECLPMPQGPEKGTMGQPHAARNWKGLSIHELNNCLDHP